MEIDSGPGIDGPQQPSANFEVGAGELVSRTISVYIRRIGAYIVIVGLPSVVLGILGLAVFFLLFGELGLTLYPGVTGADPFSLLFSYFGLLGPTGTVIGLIVIISIINTIVLAIVNGAGVKYALDNYGNREAGEIGESFSHAMGRALTLIISQLLVSLILLAIMSPIIFMAFGSLIAFDPMDPYGFLAVFSVLLPVLLVCFVLVFYISIRLTATTGVVIAEELSAIDSIKRSWELTGGNFWHVLGASLLIGIVTIIIGAVISVATLSFVLVAPAISIIVTSFISMIFVGPISNVFQAVLYKDLASRRGTQEQEWW
ncbi:MAG: glycerophosphoryl diester phosphodiesterase membrane domain-containing protein [Candidatus Thorarchaeota archaeon]|jgi:hypothetical protein